jgi:hypothetical protein
MHRSLKPWITTPWIISMIVMSGCDDRAAQVAREAADRQAQQNQSMAELNREVAAGTKRLVEADAQTRKEVVSVHRDLQAERARLDSGWNDLEQERRQMAGQRRAESLLAPTVETAGLLAVITLVLGFSWYALVKTRSSSETECAVTDLLLDEVLADNSQALLADPEKPRLLDHSGTENSPRV